MSCPDWSTLTAAPATRRRTSEPATWAEAMDHLDACGACRDEALAADPILLFRRLPEVRADADEIADMRAGVAALRRAGRVASPERAVADADPAAASAPGSWSWWGRAAAAAVLTAGLLSLQPGLEEPSATRTAPQEASSSMAWFDDGGATRWTTSRARARASTTTTTRTSAWSWSSTRPSTFDLLRAWE